MGFLSLEKVQGWAPAGKLALGGHSEGISVEMVSLGSSQPVAHTRDFTLTP